MKFRFDCLFYQYLAEKKDYLGEIFIFLGKIFYFLAEIFQFSRLKSGFDWFKREFPCLHLGISGGNFELIPYLIKDLRVLEELGGLTASLRMIQNLQLFSYAPAKFAPAGISSQVRPSRVRPAFFFCTPPHCLKKNGTLAFKH